MKITRINEPMCPRCGRGLSGFRYPDCTRPPDGMTWGEAHRVFCDVGNFADDVCADCKAGPE